MFKRKTFLTLALLTSMVSLTACGQKSSQSTPASSQSKVVQASSSSSLSKAKITTTTSTSTESSGTDVSETVDTQASATEGIQVTSSTTSFAMEAIASGDFSSLAGTWANANGQTVVIEGNKLFFLNEGELDPKHYHLIESQGFNETGGVGASVGYYNNGERQGGFHLSIVPAGVENSLGEVTDQDHLEMGHVPKSADSGEHFFRQ